MTGNVKELAVPATPSHEIRLLVLEDDLAVFDIRDASGRIARHHDEVRVPPGMLMQGRRLPTAGCKRGVRINYVVLAKPETRG